MGLVKSAVGAIGGTLADQWRDFLTVPNGIWPTAAIFPAVKVGTNAERGSNLQGSDAIISNGTRIVVPEGYGLLLFQDGGLTALATEPGGYVWNTKTSTRNQYLQGIRLPAQSLPNLGIDLSMVDDLDLNSWHFSFA